MRDAFGAKRLFLNFALPTNANSRYDFRVSTADQAACLTAALRIAKRESYIYTLAYDGLYDEESRPRRQAARERADRHRRDQAAGVQRVQARLATAAARPCRARA